MAFELTQNAKLASQADSIELNIAFEIDGIDKLYGIVDLKKYARIGEDNIEIGDPELNPLAFYIGGFIPLENQESLIDLNGTTTTIRQQLQIDRGQSSGVSSFQIQLIDLNEKITQLITPDETQTPTFDLLGRKCKVKIGFLNTDYKDDYITVFRGVITGISPGAGNVKFTINSPDNKKRKSLFKQASTELTVAMGVGDTVANVDSTADFLLGITPPGGGSPTADFETYFVVDDEIIKYTAKSAGQLQTLSRGQFYTTPATHDIGAQVNSLYRLEGNSIELALRLMLSGFNGPFVEDIAVDAINVVDSFTTVSNSLIFKETDVVDLYGIVIGDYITTSGSSFGANNVSEKEIIGISRDSEGNSIVTIDGVSFVNEITTAAIVSFRSQYDVLPDGMKMTGDEVDIAQHLFIKNTFLPAYQYDFKLDEQIDNGKEFLEEQIYSPVSAFSIPRKARASVGFHSGPIPGQNIVTLNDQNVKNPESIRIERSTERYFYNEIVYRYDKKVLEDKFLGGTIVINQDSKNRIQNREKTLTISAQGLTTLNSAENIATISANRRISRYKYAAETTRIEPLFGDGFNLEIGDIVVLDGENLKISDIKTGSRAFKTRLMEVEQKALNIKNGAVDIELVDTNFDGQQRFGLISPSSIIKSGLSSTQFIIESSYGSRFGANEYQKWEKFTLPLVTIRSKDFVTRNATRTLTNILGNTLTVDSSLGFTPQAGDVIELSTYSNEALQITLVYAFISDIGAGDFPDTTTSYVIL